MANKLRMDLELNTQGFVQGANEAVKSTKTLEQSTDDYIKSFGPLTKQLRDAKKEAENLAGRFAALSRAEKQSEIGKSLKGDLDFAIAKATELQDVLNDTREAIRRGASDTQAWDALKEGIDIAKSATLAYAGAVAELTGNEQDLAKIVKTLTVIENSFNTVIKIGNALQEQSNIMLGIKKIQKWAAAVAEDMETKAKLKNTAATAANTVAENANAAATSKATAAVAANAAALNTNRSMLQKVFSMIGKAHPYVLLGGAILTATAAIGGYMLATSKSSAEEEKAKHQKERLKKAQEELKKSQEEFVKTMSNTFGDLMSKYNNLRNAWNKLGSEHEKARWIEKNKKALNELGLSVKNVHDAEDVFEKNTSKVVDGFKKRAEAAALSARMTSLYTKSLELESQYLDRYNLLKKRAGDVDRSTSHQLDANGETYNNGESTYNKITGQFELTAKGAAKANRELTATDRILNDINDDWKENQNQIDICNNKLVKLESNLSSATSSDLTKQQKTELQKLIKVADDYNAKIENIKDPSSEKGKQELEKLKILWANAALEAEKYKHAIGLPVDTNNIEKIVDILNYTTKEAKDLKISLGIKVPNSEVEKYERELKEQLDKATEDFKIAKIHGDKAGEEAALEAYKSAYDKLNELKIKLPVEIDEDKIKKKFDEITEKLSAPKQIKYDFSGLSDAMQDEAEDALDDINRLEDAIKSYRELLKATKDPTLIEQIMEQLRKLGVDLDAATLKVKLLNDQSKSNTNFAKEIRDRGDAFGYYGQMLNGAANGLSALGDSEEVQAAQWAINSAAMIAQCIQNIAAMQAEAIASGTASGARLPFPANLAAIATIVATIGSIFASLPKFEKGGVIPGSSLFGDNVLIRANSRERVLTEEQNKNFEKIANSVSGGAYNTQTVIVEGKIKGKDLLLVQKNYNTTAIKAGQSITF